MAKATRRTSRPAARRTTARSDKTDPRDAIIDAFMALAAERHIRRIGLNDIVERAGVSLATLRETYPGKLAIFAGFVRRVDLAVLAAGPADPDSEARDRLFEVIMRRFDALAPHKTAIRRMAGAARCDPGLAALLYRFAVRSQRWTLAAAGISHGGLRGRIAVKGVTLVYAETMRTWLDDEDADLGRTMATLDKALRRGERGMQMVSDLCCVLPRMAERGRRRSQGGEAAPAG